MINTYLLQSGILAAALGAGYVAVRMPVIRKSFLPTGLGAGIILLLLSPQISGELLSGFSIPEEYYTAWSKLPHYLINVVFAALFIGKPFVSLKKMWRMAGPQIAFGQMMAWGQYAVGGVLTLLVLAPVLGLPNIAGALIEISFEGGHGTVAGISPVFRELGFQAGQELALGLATASLVTALVTGIALINWGVRSGHIKREDGGKPKRNEVYYHQVVREIREKGTKFRQHVTITNLMKHSLMVGAGVGIGWMIHNLLLRVELATWGNNGVVIMGYLPIFTFCMFGGMVVQKFCSSFSISVSRQIIELISAFALGILIMTSVGTMSIDFVSKNGFAFLILYAGGALWITLSFTVLARRMFRNNWFENGIISMGQSMGMTATGLLFAQMVDPKNKTNAVESFGYKQLLFEPLMGGGIVTALSMPLILLVGLKVFTAVCAGIMLCWMMAGLLYFGKKVSN